MHTLVLAAIVLLVTIRFFTEVVPSCRGPPTSSTSRSSSWPSGSSRAAARAPREVVLPHGAARCGVPPSQPPLCRREHRSRRDRRPVIVFLYGFLAPIGVYAVTYRVWPPGNAAALSRTLVGARDRSARRRRCSSTSRRFVHTRNPDDMSGTFGTNAYQLVYLLLVFVTLVMGITTFEPGTRVARFASLSWRRFSVSCCSPSTGRSSHRQSLRCSPWRTCSRARVAASSRSEPPSLAFAVRLLLRRDSLVVPEAGFGRHERCRIADGLS